MVHNLPWQCWRACYSQDRQDSLRKQHLRTLVIFVNSNFTENSPVARLQFPGSAGLPAQAEPKGALVTCGNSNSTKNSPVARLQFEGSAGLPARVARKRANAVSVVKTRAGYK